MDLSGLKWPVTIVVVGFVLWLFTAGGTSWMEGKMLAYTPGESTEADARNEKSLSTLGGYYSKTLRYAKAVEIFEKCGERYPEGKNYYYNLYRISRLEEGMGDSTGERVAMLGHYQKALDILKFLIDNDIHSVDARVPEEEVLRHRWEDIAEVSGLGQVGDV